MRTFDPWRGSNYDTNGIFGIRLLILGESHYDVPEKLDRSYTVDVVRRLGQQIRFRFFTKTQKLVSGVRGWVSNAERVEFWERVAFCNFIQTFPASTARCPPTLEMWEAGRIPFLQTLQELSPQLLIVLGDRLRDNLPDLPSSLPTCMVQHPSGRGFEYNKWQPLVQAAIQAVSKAT